MKTTLRNLIAAFALSAAAIGAQTINAPADHKVLVFQANAGVCQWVESWGKPCGQHVTVMILPHNPGQGVYRVTISWRGVTGNQDILTWSKMVAALDEMPSVVFPLSSADLVSVSVELAK